MKHTVKHIYSVQQLATLITKMDVDKMREINIAQASVMASIAVSESQKNRTKQMLKSFKLQVQSKKSMDEQIVNNGYKIIKSLSTGRFLGFTYVRSTWLNFIL